MPESIRMKFGMNIMAHMPISTAYFIKPFNQSACLHVYVAKQRLSEDITAATIEHTTIEELLEASLSMRFVSYQGM
jgi:heat shock protein HspQ